MNYQTIYLCATGAYGTVTCLILNSFQSNCNPVFKSNLGEPYSIWSKQVQARKFYSTSETIQQLISKSAVVTWKIKCELFNHIFCLLLFSCSYQVIFFYLLEWITPEVIKIRGKDYEWTKWCGQWLRDYLLVFEFP